MLLFFVNHLRSTGKDLFYGVFLLRFPLSPAFKGPLIRLLLKTYRLVISRCFTTFLSIAVQGMREVTLHKLYLRQGELAPVTPVALDYESEEESS